MQQNKIHILSTRPLQQKIIENAVAKNTSIDTISFIETSPIVDDALKKDITGFSAEELTVVFTSMNAVESVSRFLNKRKPHWKIFCLGSTTKNLIKENFGENSIAGSADSASALADVIVAEKKIGSVVFFCGDQRRDELPEKLSQHGIEVREMRVYRTIKSSHQITGDYDAIIFYSPSAVNSFFSINKINHRAILFAIGNTTACEIKKYAENKIIIAEKPSKEFLVEQAVNYFQTNPIHH